MDQFPRINRLPPYIFSVMDQLKTETRAGGADVIDFGMGNPDLPTPPHIVEALRSAVLNPATHRYAPSKGIPGLRQAISEWYGKKFNVDLDPETETIATVGSKEGLAHLALAMVDTGDTIIAPNPCYPVHHFGFVIANSDVLYVPMVDGVDFIEGLEQAIKEAWPKPKVIVINFPANPTTHCVDLPFFEKIIDLAKQNKIWVIHDLAYADLVFDGYRAPSILEVAGAKDWAVESYTLSKTYNMAGWRVGFMCGNAKLIGALARIKSYIDYGSFAPIQEAATLALSGPQDCVIELRQRYQDRRDVLCQSLNAIGWEVTPPKATMFVWAKIPKAYEAMGSLAFSQRLCRDAHVVVSPGVGFGEYGNQYVRIGMIEDAVRIREAVSRIDQLFRSETLLETHREEFELE